MLSPIEQIRTSVANAQHRRLQRRVSMVTTFTLGLIVSIVVTDRFVQYNLLKKMEAELHQMHIHHHSPKTDAVMPQPIPGREIET